MSISLEIVYAILIFLVFVAAILRITLHVFDDEISKEQDEESIHTSNTFSNS